MIPVVLSSFANSRYLALAGAKGRLSVLARETFALIDNCTSREGGTRSEEGGYRWGWLGVKPRKKEPLLCVNHSSYSGHIALIDWKSYGLKSEFDVREPVKAVQFLHTEVLYHFPMLAWLH